MNRRKTKPRNPVVRPSKVYVERDDGQNLDRFNATVAEVLRLSPDQAALVREIDRKGRKKI